MCRLIAGGASTIPRVCAIPAPMSRYEEKCTVSRRPGQAHRSVKNLVANWTSGLFAGKLARIIGHGAECAFEKPDWHYPLSSSMRPILCKDMS